MSQENLATIVKIVESLSDTQQERVIEYLREYITDIEDEIQWNRSFEKTESKLVTLARLAKQQITQGQSQPMDYDQL